MTDATARAGEHCVNLHGGAHNADMRFPSRSTRRAAVMTAEFAGLGAQHAQVASISPGASSTLARRVTRAEASIPVDSAETPELLGKTAALDFHRPKVEGTLFPLRRGEQEAARGPPSGSRRFSNCSSRPRIARICRFNAPICSATAPFTELRFFTFGLLRRVLRSSATKRD